MADFVSPNTGNLAVFKGQAFFTPAGGGSRRSLGNATAVTATMTVDKLDHFSSMAGVKTKDKSIVVSKSMTVDITLEEMSMANMLLAFLATEGARNTEHNRQGNIGADSEVVGMIELIGANDVGPRFSYEFPSVSVTPNGGVNLISDADWSAIEVTGDVAWDAVHGRFGTFELQDSSVTEEQENSEA